ncbi:hypothetical protein Anapl_00311 [Anas platyrhynchos]|uniref:Secreted protein n=1 Tax=Anas platyrhynchos TaxID=8839 RepID=R0KCH2_ANAPL|nr:hypothetical protein Anapl_00311 [Anas platyrhynchos]
MWMWMWMCLSTIHVWCSDSGAVGPWWAWTCTSALSFADGSLHHHPLQEETCRQWSCGCPVPGPPMHETESRLARKGSVQIENGSARAFGWEMKFLVQTSAHLLVNSERKFCRHEISDLTRVGNLQKTDVYVCVRTQRGVHTWSTGVFQILCDRTWVLFRCCSQHQQTSTPLGTLSSLVALSVIRCCCDACRVLPEGRLSPEAFLSIIKDTCNSTVLDLICLISQGTLYLKDKEWGRLHTARGESDLRQLGCPFRCFVMNVESMPAFLPRRGADDVQIHDSVLHNCWYCLIGLAKASDCSVTLRKPLTMEI